MIYIRPAGNEDVAAICEFQLRLAFETENIVLDKETVTKGVSAVLADPSKGKYFAAEDGGRVVGCLLITFEWSEWRNAMVWWLQSVYVSQSHRRLGVFAKMYTHIIELIKGDPSIGGLRLYVDKQNHQAQKVYHALGMNGDHYTVFEWMKP